MATATFAAGCVWGVDGRLGTNAPVLIDGGGIANFVVRGVDILDAGSPSISIADSCIRSSPSDRVATQ